MCITHTELSHKYNFIITLTSKGMHFRRFQMLTLTWWGKTSRTQLKANENSESFNSKIEETKASQNCAFHLFRIAAQRRIPKGVESTGGYHSLLENYGDGTKAVFVTHIRWTSGRRKFKRLKACKKTIHKSDIEGIFFDTHNDSDGNVRRKTGRVKTLKT